MTEVISREMIDGGAAWTEQLCGACGHCTGQCDGVGVCDTVKPGVEVATDGPACMDFVTPTAWAAELALQAAEGDSPVAPSLGRQVVEVPVGMVEPSPYQPRRVFEEGALAELAASISAHGVLQPISVRVVDYVTGADGALVRVDAGEGPGCVSAPADAEASCLRRYQLIAGERRWRACQVAGLATVPALLVTCSDLEAAQLSLLENLQRSDLNAMEEAEGYQRLLDLGMTQQQLAERIHRSQPSIANALRLLKLPKDVRVLIDGGTLSAAHGRALARFSAFPAACSRIAQYAVDNGVSSKGLEGKEVGVYSLVHDKLAVEFVSYGAQATAFDFRTDCANCEAYRSNLGHSPVCFRPACYAEKQQAGLAAMRARAEAQREAALAAGKDGADLDALAWDQVQQLDGRNTPSGCREVCEKRVDGLRGGREGTWCLDPKCWKKLRAADEREEDARNRAAADARLAEVRVVAEETEDGRRRALAYAVAEIVQYRDRETILPAAARCGVVLSDAVLAKNTYQRTAAAIAGELAQYDVPKLTQFAVDVQLCFEAGCLARGPRCTTRMMAFVMGDGQQADGTSALQAERCCGACRHFVGDGDDCPKTGLAAVADDPDCEQFEDPDGDDGPDGGGQAADGADAVGVIDAASGPVFAPNCGAADGSVFNQHGVQVRLVEELRFALPEPYRCVVLLGYEPHCQLWRTGHRYGKDGTAVGCGMSLSGVSSHSAGMADAEEAFTLQAARCRHGLIDEFGATAGVLKAFDAALARWLGGDLGVIVGQLMAAADVADAPAADPCAVEEVAIPLGMDNVLELTVVLQEDGDAWLWGARGITTSLRTNAPQAATLLDSDGERIPEVPIIPCATRDAALREALEVVLDGCKWMIETKRSGTGTQAVVDALGAYLQRLPAGDVVDQAGEADTSVDWPEVRPCPRCGLIDCECALVDADMDGEE